jgi:hypothetical protein
MLFVHWFGGIWVQSVLLARATTRDRPYAITILVGAKRPTPEARQARQVPMWTQAAAVWSRHSMFAPEARMHSTGSCTLALVQNDHSKNTSGEHDRERIRRGLGKHRFVGESKNAFGERVKTDWRK